jgi:hypothetical protein
MSSTAASAETASNLLLSSEQRASAPARVFDGEQRVKALALLAAAVAEQRVMAVMQLVNKDPSLAFETLQIPLRGTTGGQTTPVEFPLACLRAGLSAGYVFAISRGFGVDSLLQNESTTLLQDALGQGGAGRNCEADLSLLLSMGARPQAMPSQESLYAVVADAFPAKSDKHSIGAIAMLLDAKVDFAYPSTYKCPYSVMVGAHGWGNPDIASSLTRLMARFVKAGLSIERATGAPAQTPLQRALGSKNGDAVVSLLRLGAKSGPEVLNGKDLFALMDAQGLEQFKPGAQAALMESHISRSTAKAAAAAPAAPSDASESVPAPASRRRRLGAV